MNPVPCPCGSARPYSDCCGPLHGGTPADTAEALMRSRFSAFARGLDGYLLASWHPTTRPDEIDLHDGTVWRRLQIVDTVAGGVGDLTGVVEFRASFRDAEGAAGLLHERSRFARVPEEASGRWMYRDGQVSGAPRGVGFGA